MGGGGGGGVEGSGKKGGIKKESGVDAHPQIISQNTFFSKRHHY